MAHNPQMQRATDGRSLMKTNKTKSLNAAFMSEHVIYNSLEVPASSKHGPEYFCRSHATSFSRSGISSGGKHYSRCPITGTWFKHDDERRRELHDSRSDLAYRYTESRQDKGDNVKTYTIWAAPCPPGSFFKEPINKPQKPVQFGHTDGPVTRTVPMDPRDMPDPLSPLTRTVSAPNFVPQTKGNWGKAMNKSQGSAMSRSGSLARSGQASMGQTM